MSGKVIVIGFGEFLLGGILHQDAPEVTFEGGDFAGDLLPLLEQGQGEGLEHEGDGEAVGAFPDVQMACFVSESVSLCFKSIAS